MTTRARGTAGARLRVRVQPKASANRLTFEAPGRIRAAVTAPPADGAANQAVCALIAKKLGVAKSKVRLKSGMRSRDKVIEVDGVDEVEAARRLSAQSAD